PKAVVTGKARTGRGGVGSGQSVNAPPPRVAGSPVTLDSPKDFDDSLVLSPEQKRRADLQSKFNPSVLAVIDRLKDPKATPAADEARFIHNGKAELQIWLTDKSAETMAKLKELGF